MRSSTGFNFELDDDLCEGNLVAVIATTPKGHAVELWAEVELVGQALILRQFAIYGIDVAAGGLGSQALVDMAQAAMEVFGVDTVRIEEARRTSGGNPGRTARTLEFHRRPPKDGSAATG